MFAFTTFTMPLHSPTTDGLATKLATLLFNCILSYIWSENVDFQGLPCSRVFQHFVPIKGVILACDRVSKTNFISKAILKNIAQRSLTGRLYLPLERSLWQDRISTKTRLYSDCIRQFSPIVLVPWGYQKTFPNQPFTRWADFQTWQTRLR